MRLKGDHDLAVLFPALQKAMGLDNVFKRDDASNDRLRCATFSPLRSQFRSQSSSWMLSVSKTILIDIVFFRSERYVQIREFAEAGGMGVTKEQAVQNREHILAAAEPASVSAVETQGYELLVSLIFEGLNWACDAVATSFICFSQTHWMSNRSWRRSTSRMVCPLCGGKRCQREGYLPMSFNS
jgi:hypothetical protein